MAGAKAGAKKRASAAGRELGRLGAKKGGRARARALSPAERSDIARRAVQVRWAKSGRAVDTTDGDSQDGAAIPRSLFRGPLTIGGVRFESHILSDGRRILERTAVLDLLTGEHESEDLDRYLRRVPGFDDRLLPIDMVTLSVPGRAGRLTGYQAESVVDICEQFLVARETGSLKKQQLRVASRVESILRECARAGLVGLIDEATGFQRVRARQALQFKLQAFIADEVGQWAEVFPPRFWKELARLDGSKYTSHQRPIGWGRLVVAFVYDAVDPDLGRELRRGRPEPASGPALHAWLLERGRCRLERQTDRIVATMALCHDMADFESRFAKVLQKSPLRAQEFDDRE